MPVLAAKGKTLEFKAGLTISETAIGSSGSCALIFAVTGSGYATSLGPVTFTSTDCVNPGVDGTLTFTSTNVSLKVAGGDTLTGSYDGTATPQPAPFMGIRGDVTFDGGSGRFMNASGAATIDGVEVITFTPPSGAGTLFISGSITLPK
ncbi:MAG: hypothetical protein ABIX46_03575 [Burkholderiaceae bacterium]